MITDEEIIERLDEVAGFKPCDNWSHIIREMKTGKIYFARQLNREKFGVRVVLALIPRA